MLNSSVASHGADVLQLSVVILGDERVIGEMQFAPLPRHGLPSDREMNMCRHLAGGVGPWPDGFKLKSPVRTADRPAPKTPARFSRFVVEPPRVGLISENDRPTGRCDSVRLQKFAVNDQRLARFVLGRDPAS